MRLKSVTIQSFRNFVEAQTIEIEPDVTCLVGKNESGKTTILQALHRLNPANGSNLDFNLTKEYPRWRLAKDRRADPDLADREPVRATFAMDPDDVEALSEALPAPLVDGTICTAGRSYSGTLTVRLTADLPTVVRTASEEAGVEAEDLDAILQRQTFMDARGAAQASAKTLKKPAPQRSKALTKFVSVLRCAVFIDEHPA